MRLLLACILAQSCSEAFAFSPPAARVSLRRLPTTVGVRMVADDDEIKALEARLAELKEKQAAAVAASEASDATEVAATEAKLAELKDGFDMTTLSNRKRVAAIQDSAPIELLSESWKEEEEDDSEGGGGLAVGLGGVLGGIVLFVALSLVPVGSDGASRCHHRTRTRSPHATGLRPLSRRCRSLNCLCPFGACAQTSRGSTRARRLRSSRQRRSGRGTRSSVWPPDPTSETHDGGGRRRTRCGCILLKVVPARSVAGFGASRFSRL